MNLRKKFIQRGIYSLVLLAIAIFLYKQGIDPWQHLAQHWQVFLEVMLITSIGIIVQAKSYKASIPSTTTINAPGITDLIRIWSMSGAMSVVLPFFAGFGTRTTLLVQAGMPLSATLTTSGRQAWMGLEYALLIGGLAAPFLDYVWKIWLAIVLLSGWATMFILRVFAGKWEIAPHTKITRLLQTISSPIPLNAHIWFSAQIAMMSMTYFAAFNGFGADLSWADVLALSALTVIASLVILIPNGMGVMDTIWVAVGTKASLTLSASVAFALTLRLSYLGASVLILSLTTIFIRTLKNKNE